MLHKAWNSKGEMPYCFPRSSIKVTQDKTSPILTQIGRFRTIGRSQLSNPSDLPCSRSYIKFQQGSKNRRIWPKLGVSGQQLQFEFTDGYEMLHKAWNSKGEVPYCFPRSSIKFQGHMRQNITDFDPNWAFPDYRPVAAFKSLRFALLMIACCQSGNMPFILNCGKYFWHHMVSLSHNELTHCGPVTPYGDINVAQHWFR